MRGVLRSERSLSNWTASWAKELSSEWFLICCDGPGFYVFARASSFKVRSIRSSRSHTGSPGELFRSKPNERTTYGFRFAVCDRSYVIFKILRTVVPHRYAPAVPDGHGCAALSDCYAYADALTANEFVLSELKTDSETKQGSST